MRTNIGILLLRIAFGGTMALNHGYGKLLTFSEKAQTFPDPFGFLGSHVSLGLVIFAEFFCSIAIVLGLLTRLATIPLIITMAVAFFIIHAADPFSTKELAGVYFSVFSALFLLGPGRFSIDSYFLKRN